MPHTRSVVLVGVGGQGVVLAGTILGDVALAAGFDVKTSEVHGMSKRGGVVFSHVRYGATVHSPLTSVGEADALVAFEWAEALRWLPYLRPDGLLVVDAVEIVPPAAQRDHRGWTRAYPSRDVTPLADHCGPVLLADAHGLAQRMGDAHAANMVLLGALAARLEFLPETWEAVIATHVPARTVETNVRAFREGGRLETAPPVRADDWPPAVGRTASRIEITAPWCKACDVCVRVCPEGCLRLGDGVAEVVNADLCTGCRLCERLCPDFAITVHAPGPAPRSGP